MIGEYNIIKKIGRGSFSNVFKANHTKTNIFYAIKSIKTKNLSQKIIENLNSEIEILSNINHPNIIKIYDIIKTEDHIHLVLDYCDGGDLHNFIQKNGKIQENISKYFYTQISCGLYYLWKNNLIHRDLKPHNILLSTSGNIKITDFGFVKHLESQNMSSTLCGSPLYMAPEILKRQKYNSKIDLWSMGVILYEMITNTVPFIANNPFELLHVIETTKFEMPKNISESCKHLLTSLLSVNVDKRISYELYFNHEFFDNFDFKYVNENIKSESKDIQEKYVKIIKIYIKSIYYSSSEIMHMAIERANKCESLCLYLKSISLYSHAINICYTTFKKYDKSKELLNKILTSLYTKFIICMTNSEHIIKTIPQNVEVVVAEKLIYDYALEMTKKALSEEYLDNNIKAIKLYVWSLRLFESLTMDEVSLNKHDAKIINNFIYICNSRIKYIEENDSSSIVNMIKKFTSFDF
jgi:serine/threonine protein kinase